MRRAIVFGGLSANGFVITKRLLEDGVDVFVFSSALCAQELGEETERELFVGRHDCFHRESDAGWREGSCDALFLADLLRPLPLQTLALIRRVSRLFHGRQVNDMRCMLLLSAWCINRRPEGEEKACDTADEDAAWTERFFSRRVMRCAPEKAAILRTDNMASPTQVADIAVRLVEASFQGLEIFTYSGRADRALTNRKVERIIGRL
ncbi:MAG: hypothetical protein ABF868_05565 [Sporolactobacillus sp.]